MVSVQPYASPALAYCSKNNQCAQSTALTLNTRLNAPLFQGISSAQQTSDQILFGRSRPDEPEAKKSGISGVIAAIIAGAVALIGIILSGLRGDKKAEAKADKAAKSETVASDEKARRQGPDDDGLSGVRASTREAEPDGDQGIEVHELVDADLTEARTSAEQALQDKNAPALASVNA